MSKKGESLLQRMKDTKWGWTRDDLGQLYKAFGFELTKTGRRRPHLIYVHPEFPHLRATVSHSSSSLPIGYITHAIKTIEELKRLKGASDERS